MGRLGDLSRCRGVLFGISTCWLMLFHSTNIDFTKAEWMPHALATALMIIKNSGNIGVDVFLILSGIGLYYSYSKDNDLWSFYKRRAARILTPVLICSTLWFGISNVKGLFTYLVFVNLGGVFVYGESYFWYFSLIILLYLVFPILNGLLTQHKRLVLLGICLIVGWSLLLMLSLKTDFFARSEIALTRIPAFIIGCMLAPYVQKVTKYSKSWVAIGTIILVPLIIVYATIPLAIIIHRYIGTICALIIVVVLSEFFVKMKAQNPARIALEVLGNYSMEIYLLYSATAILCVNVFNVYSSTGIAYYIPVSVLTFVMAVGLKGVSESVNKRIRDVSRVD